MADIKDPEKAAIDRIDTHDHAAKAMSTGSDTDEKVPRRDSHSSSGSASHISRDSDDDLEPLEEAISPILQEVMQVRTTTSIGSSASRPPDFEVDFDEHDNPRNWSVWVRTWNVVVISFATWTVVLYSTSYTSAIPGIMAYFNEPSQFVATLGVTAYLLGLAVGTLLFAPMSELKGRRPVYIVNMFIFILLIIPSALATSLAEIIVVRFFGAIFGAATIATAAGSIVDLTTEENRALVLSLWSIAPLNGPVTGPVIGGFIYEYLGWRWDSWITLILAGAAAVLTLTLRETYAPTILQRKAAQMRKENNDERWWSRYDVKKSPIELLRVNLIRPFILFFTEPILWFFNIWISIIYGILYLTFVAYPIVFTEYRGWGPGLTGLSFVGIGIGTTIAIVGEPLWRKIINKHPRDPDGRLPPEATARILVIGSILTPVGQLVFAWTCLPATIHWAIPIAFGIPFGLGNAISFIYGSNYISGAYGIYAASALAGNAFTRSLAGGFLPLAGPQLYATLTPHWAGTFLGLLQVALIPIPFVFWRYGDKIRARSPAIRSLREDQERMERKAAKLQQKLQKHEKKAEAAEEGMIVKEETV
ncbi:major facilitator superfamily transporter [Xylariaceae sp. FL0255]|nr:major facilitator superfamily transporter [Xylariaceae sp. FL0255]